MFKYQLRVTLFQVQSFPLNKNKKVIIGSHQNRYMFDSQSIYNSHSTACIRSERMLDIVMEEGSRVPPDPPSPHTPTLSASLYCLSCWILARSWDSSRETRNHSAYLLVGMELFQYLNNHCGYTAECEPCTVGLYFTLSIYGQKNPVPTTSF